MTFVVKKPFHLQLKQKEECTSNFTKPSAIISKKPSNSPPKHQHIASNFDLDFEDLFSSQSILKDIGDSKSVEHVGQLTSLPSTLCSEHVSVSKCVNSQQSPAVSDTTELYEADEANIDSDIASQFEDIGFNIRPSSPEESPVHSSKPIISPVKVPSPTMRNDSLYNVRDPIADFISKISVKPLGIDKECYYWLEEVTQNEASLKMTEETPSYLLKENIDFLNKSYLQIMERVVTCVENIPGQLLEKLPGFDPNVFAALRTSRRRIKAKLIQTENLFKRQQSNNSNNQSQATSVTPNTWPKQGIPVNATASCVTTYNNNVQPTMSSWCTDNPAQELNASFVDYTDVLYNKTQKTPEKSPATKPLVRFRSGMINDGTSGEFDGEHFPHSKIVMQQLRSKFGLKSFRPNQLQVINAALLGHDCFVLMPTGGGKSLCYQLPAVISPGVTVVISPLRSLILDQVTKLLNLDISAAYMTGDLSDKEVRKIYNNLKQAKPPYKLLYVTPEKISASNTFQNCLKDLYQRNMLSRFVIDEVHCVSQWGHDFRPDYKKLQQLRINFPTVNIIALTATATPRVRTDILHQLQISKTKWFLSSFNRANLRYSVLQKNNSSVDYIANLIKSDFSNETGVIYCFSRNECETVSDKLRACGINSVAYHAGLSDSERSRIQNLWMNDKAKVVCATIAFGMGIDKPDVRFVFHFSLPKSIEGYYQESGRAGRDGEKAVCILFYSMQDRIRILKLISLDQSAATAEARRIHVDNVFRVSAFAENVADCRRAIQLEYFGEVFDRSLCLQNRATTCDNCLNQDVYETLDVTKESKAIIECVLKVCEGNKKANYTMPHFASIFKGSQSEKIKEGNYTKLSMYSMGKAWDRKDVDRLFRKLINEEYLKERLVVQHMGNAAAYIEVGRKGLNLLSGKGKITFHRKKSGKSTKDHRTVFGKQTNPAIQQLQSRCYASLRGVLDTIGSATGFNPYAIMNQEAIRAMSVSMPETPEEMMAINHVTEANFIKYGEALLDVTKKFAEERRALQPPPRPMESSNCASGSIFSDLNVEASDMEEKSSRYFEEEDEREGPEVSFEGGKRKRGVYRHWRGSKRGKAAASKGRSRSRSSLGKGASTSSTGKATYSKSKPLPSVSHNFNVCLDLPATKKTFLKKL